MFEVAVCQETSSTAISSASTQIHSVQPQALQEEYSYSVCLSGAADTRLQLGSFAAGVLVGVLVGFRP